MLPPCGYACNFYVNCGIKLVEIRTDPTRQIQPIGFDEVKRIGFELLAQGKVRRLTQGIYAIKADSGSYITENQEGHWKCDCNTVQNESCPHIYASQLSGLTDRVNLPNEGTPLKCRYCGSPDVRGCGFRYNAKGIAHRYFCYECRRKFSVKYVGSNAPHAPSELIWLLNELGATLTRANDLIAQVDRKLTES
jgi:hypothetical protein